MDFSYTLIRESEKSEISYDLEVKLHLYSGSGAIDDPSTIEINSIKHHGREFAATENEQLEIIDAFVKEQEES